MDLSKFRFVLIETSHPGNIGAAARAMCTMGVGELVLVRPKDYPSPEASVRAAGAADYLARAVVVNSLEEAIGDCVLVLGTSSRQRTLPWPVIPAHELGTKMASSQAVGTQKVAILFGCEASGLSNQELQTCTAHILIDANPAYNVLNLAMAVQIIAYELRIGAARTSKVPSDTSSNGVLALPNYWDAPAASHAEVEHLLDHWDEILQQLAFYEPENPRQLLVRLRRLIQRVRLDHLEVGLLRGFLRAVQERAGSNYPTEDRL